jgi:hypothetical protein
MRQVKVTHFLEDGSEEVSYVDVTPKTVKGDKVRKVKKKSYDKDNS